MSTKQHGRTRRGDPPRGKRGLKFPKLTLAPVPAPPLHEDAPPHTARTRGARTRGQASRAMRKEPSQDLCARVSGMQLFSSPRPRAEPRDDYVGDWSTTVNVGFLKQIELFSDMPDKALEDMLKQLVPVSYAEGNVVINDGDDDYEFMIVLRGQIDCRHPMVTREVLRLEPGDVFGEQALLRRSSMLRTLQIVSDAVILTLRQSSFLRHVTPHTFKRYEGSQMHEFLGTTRGLMALKEECEEFLALEPDSAYLKRILREANWQLGLRNKQQGQKDTEKSTPSGTSPTPVEYYWQNKRNRQLKNATESSPGQFLRKYEERAKGKKGAKALRTGLREQRRCPTELLHVT